MTLIEKFFVDAIRFEKIKDDITLMYDITGGNGFEVGYKKGNYTVYVPMLCNYKKKLNMSRFDKRNNEMVCCLYTNLAHELCHIVKEDSRYLKVGFLGYNNELKALNLLKESRADFFSLNYMLNHYKKYNGPDYRWMDEKDEDGVRIDYKNGGYLNREKRIELLQKFLTYRPNTVKFLFNIFEFDRFTTHGKVVHYVREKYKRQRELMYFSGLMYYKIEKL